MTFLYDHLYGLIELPWWGYLLLGLILTQISVLGVTLYLHRCQAHRAIEMHPIPAHFFRFWIWMTTGMLTREWAAVHRKHHARCETEGDPHSPQVLGLRKVMLEGAELYRDAADDKELVEKYGKGTPDDWIERNLYSRFRLLGVSLLFLVNLVLFGAPGITLWAVQVMFMPLFAAGVVNGLGHYWGYRNFECPDAARNIIPIGFFLGGEELHNNHHTYGTSAKFSVKWWEFDMGWLVISLLRPLGLVKVNRVPPKPVVHADKALVDGETLTAVFHNRFQVLATYSRSVILPVLQDEKNRAGKAGKKLFQRARVALTRHHSVVREADKARLQALLAHSQALQVVHEYQEQLKALWQQRSLDKDELVAALKQWCAEAEATGIKALQDFSRHLRTLAPMPVPA